MIAEVSRGQWVRFPVLEEQTASGRLHRIRPSVPGEVDDSTQRSGWLKFGEPRFAVPRLGPFLEVQPRPGRLVLFPSYLWHGTNALRGDSPRMSVAFDAVPRAELD